MSIPATLAYQYLNSVPTVQRPKAQELSLSMPMSPKSGGARSFIKGLVHSRTNSDTNSAVNPSDAVSSTELVGKQPRWLTKFLTDPKHRGRVLEELAERERLRAQHRKAMPLTSTLNSSASASNSKKPSESQLAEFYATRTASSSENRGANRYADVLPYDRHSVFVNTQVGGSDNLDGAAYLNASWVKETASQVWWIASQGTLPPALISHTPTLFPENIGAQGSTNTWDTFHSPLVSKVTSVLIVPNPILFLRETRLESTCRTTDFV